MMNSRGLLNVRYALVLVCWLALVGAMTAAEGPRRPNVLVILADDMGYSDAGCYGGEIETPNIDALAAGGLRFSQFYNTARCWPTRAALLTGYYAQQVRRDALPGNRTGGGQGTRPAWAPLLPAMLGPLGYRSYHSGKWHIDGQPLTNGFDRSYQVEDHNSYFRPKRHFEDGEPLPPVEADRDYYVTTAIADHALQQLREHAELHGDQPFFQFLCFTAPHFPLQALADDIARYRQRYQVGWNAIQAERGERLLALGLVRHMPPSMETELGPPYAFQDLAAQLGPGEVLRPVAWDELSDAQQQLQAAKMAIHAAMIDCMDREIGRVIEQLKQMEALDDTLVLFLSDNGASAEIMVRGEGHDQNAAPGSAETFLCLGPGWSSAANTPFRRHKTWVHEGGISTPLVAHWPRGIAARGELRHTPGHAVDIWPTVLELAGAEEPVTDGDGPPRPGHSLVDVFRADQPERPVEIWWLHDGHRALRSGDWKIVANKEEPWELYDLSVDRGETSDLASQHPERVREMEAIWTARVEEFSKQAQ